MSSAPEAKQTAQGTVPPKDEPLTASTAPGGDGQGPAAGAAPKPTLVAVGRGRTSQPEPIEPAPTSLAVPLTWSERAVVFLLDLIPWLGSLLTAASATLFVFFYVVTLAEWDKVPKNAVPATLHALVYAGVCAFPFILNGGVALLMRKSRRLRLERDGDLPAIPGGVEKLVGGEAIQATKKEWRHYRDLAETTSERTLHFGMMYGATVSLVLAGVIWIGATTLLFGARPEEAVSTARVDGAYAIGATTIVSVLRDFSRLVVRAAARDGNARVFARSIRRLIVCQLAVMGFVALFHLQSVDGSIAVLKNRFSWVALGIAVAIVGEKTLDVITDKLSTWFGATPVRRDPDADLQQLDGMTPDDVLRLEEEGISTVHSLALQASPRLYFHLPYSFRELLEWQDQAMLLDHFGKSRAAYIRQNALIRHMSDIWAAADRFLSAGTEASERTALAHQLGFASEAEAKSGLERIHRDGNIVRLVIFREAFAPAAPQPNP